MLERTAACLESSSLRRLLPGSKTSLKSRRMLHSAFWTHSAGNLDILWTALVQGQEQNNARDQKTSSVRGGGISTKPIFDFLYPLGALNFIRSCSSWTTDRTDIRRKRAEFGRFGQRLYTSGRDNPALEGVEGLELSLQDLIPITREDEYEEAWRQYELSEGHTQERLRPLILMYLMTSNRMVDAERSITTFNLIEIKDRDAKHYEAGIRANLLYDDFETAMNLHNESSSRLHKSRGGSMLLADLIKKSDWDLAANFWKSTNNISGRTNPNYNVWKYVDAIPDLQDKALALLSFVNDLDHLDLNHIVTSSNTLSIVPEFAQKLLLRALIPRQSGAQFDGKKFLILLKQLHNWGSSDQALFENNIPKLLEINEPHIAVRCYRYYRKHATGKISRGVLDQILSVCCKHHSLVGMQQVLDDWFRFHGHPSGLAYRMCLGEFADQGDLSTVKALFAQYTSRATKSTDTKSGRLLRSADDVAPLLHVHAKRAELPEAIQIFESMEEEYGVKPNVRCWNILINAYGKTQNVDGAVALLKMMMDEGGDIKPDDYTFGTLMGMSAARSDVETVVELQRIAEKAQIRQTPAMIDPLVLCYVYEDKLPLAEKICEEALSKGVKGNLTYMWNCLLTAYAMRRDIQNVNRLLNRMKEAGIQFDSYTYAALMQALCMIKQPLRAFVVLTSVMPQAKIRATSFHYAVVMGGFISTREYQRVFQLHQRMLEKNIQGSISTRLMAMKGSAIEDQRLLRKESPEVQLARAEEIFSAAYGPTDAGEVADPHKKGLGHQPLDIAKSSSYYNYLIFVYGQKHAFERVKLLYDKYTQNVNKSQQEKPPVNLLSALMISNLNENNFEGVQQCWDLAFKQAKAQAAPTMFAVKRRTKKANSSATDVLPLYRYLLSKSISTQMISLARQKKFNELVDTVKEVQAAGFYLDNKNWNIYIQLLANAFMYRQAFHTCEKQLMPNWTGWARLRQKAPVRNRLPQQLRRLRKMSNHVRPMYHTLLYLTKGFMEIEGAIDESKSARVLMHDLKANCPLTLYAITTMPRTSDPFESEILNGT